MRPPVLRRIIIRACAGCHRSGTAPRCHRVGRRTNPEQPCHEALPPVGTHPRYFTHLHRPCRKPQQVLSDARPARYRPARLAGTDQPGRRREIRGKSRLSCSGAPIVRIKRCCNERMLR